MRALLAAALALLAAAPAAGAALPMHPCVKGRFQCGRLTVPLDYGAPGGPTLSIPVTRLRASRPKHRIGTVFVNYGGPGADAVATTQQVGAGLFRAFRRRFDVVAFDPRGTGTSRPDLNCRVDQERVGLYRHPYLTPATYDRTAALLSARRYVALCAARTGTLAQHLSTANVARDMDAVRAALGVGRITYVGFSYGTFLGATYARLFPAHLRAMVLDGPVDARAYVSDPIGDLNGQTLGFEDALDRFLSACGRAPKACRWTRGRSPRAAYDRLVRRADAHPLRVRHPKRTDGSRRRVDGDVLAFAVAGDLYAKQLWPDLSAALGGAARGDGTALRALADDGYGRRKDGGYYPDNDRYFLIGAAEQRFPRTPEPYEAAGANAFARTPDFRFNTGYTVLDYSVSGPRDADAYLGPFVLPAGAPTPLVVGTTHDPATPYDGARALVAQLGRGRLLTMRGDGHTAYGGNSACIDRAVDAYVRRLRLPARGRTCRQHVPFPARPARASAAGGTIPASLIARRGR